MKRAENCADSKINHVSIIDDSLSIDFAKSKGDQDGEANQGPWHMHANPSNPETCVYLALSRCIFTFTEVTSNGAAMSPMNLSHHQAPASSPVMSPLSPMIEAPWNKEIMSEDELYFSPAGTFVRPFYHLS